VFDNFSGGVLTATSEGVSTFFDEVTTTGGCIRYGSDLNQIIETTSKQIPLNAQRTTILTVFLFAFADKDAFPCLLILFSLRNVLTDCCANYNPYSRAVGMNRRILPINLLLQLKWLFFFEPSRATIAAQKFQKI